MIANELRTPHVDGHARYLDEIASAVDVSFEAMHRHHAPPVTEGCSEGLL